MQDQDTRQHIQDWPISKVALAIGSIVLLAVAAYMAYVFIDAQALHETLSR